MIEMPTAHRQQSPKLSGKVFQQPVATVEPKRKLSYSKARSTLKREQASRVRETSHLAVSSLMPRGESSGLSLNASATILDAPRPPQQSTPALFTRNQVGRKQPAGSKGRVGRRIGLLKNTYRAALLQLFGSTLGRNASSAGSGFRGAEPLEDSLFSAEGLLEAHNPFEEALSAKEMDGVQENLQTASDALPDNQSPDPVPPSDVQMLGSVSGSPQANLDGPFDYLLIGDFPNDSGRRVFRANRSRNDDFILDNSFVFTLSGGFLVFEQGEQVLASELDGDEGVDLVVVKQRSGEGLVEIFSGKGGVRFDRMASFSISQRVIGVSAFELTGDGKDDLAFIIEDTPHLTIFERKGDQFEYLKELVMPFRPGLVAEAPGGIADARRLDILDRSLHEVVSITSEFPDYLETGADPVSTNSRTLMVASRTGGGGSVKFRVFEYPERITLAIETPDDLRFVGSFSTTDQVPLVIVGDYHGTGSRQVIYVP